MKPIPIAAARKIAVEFDYHQVVVIARAVGTGAEAGEHVTTYGIDAPNCAVAAQIGDFLKFKVMGWASEEKHEDLRYDAFVKMIEKSAAMLDLVDGGLTLLKAGVTADDTKRENLLRIVDLQREVRDIVQRLRASSSGAAS
jgi:hypothetical protein